MIFIAFIRNTTNSAINNHYGLIRVKSEKLYANIFTTKPYGNYYKISDCCINKKYQSPQYLMDKVYLLSEKHISKIPDPMVDQYLIDHMDKFKEVLKEIDINTVINLIS